MLSVELVLDVAILLGEIGGRGKVSVAEQVAAHDPGSSALADCAPASRAPKCRSGLFPRGALRACSATTIVRYIVLNF